MDSTTLRETVRTIVGEMSPLGNRAAHPADRLVEDLGYDSLAVIELSIRIEQDFALRLTPTESATTPDVKTVADIETFVAERMPAEAVEEAGLR
ncbi:acyl carrier protein [Streptomyces sp. A7024]|uniref:Acyl carrier protein n=1 Tax=Streptomyces coryli TaxID=1128680 RepID=A0A6G4U6W6_9ACTN|nr:acyl carrier protein [Streptomyces coryli]NGN67985.1 acyl carrier protein [Streptomyces coryli]